MKSRRSIEVVRKGRWQEAGLSHFPPALLPPQDLRSAARHVAVGIACVAGVAGSVVLTEKAWLQDVRAIRSLSRGAPLPRAESADSSKKKVQ